MTIDSATAMELVGSVTGILILAVAIYAQRKFHFAIFTLGWNIIAASGALMAIGSLFRAYYTYAGLYEEFVSWGRACLVADRIVLLMGIYVLTVVASELWDEKEEK